MNIGSAFGEHGDCMRILLTNDDGIEARGLQVLREIAATLSDDVWIVAPETDQSGAAHSLTLHEPLRLRKAGERRYAVRGTPTDCVIMAVRHVLTDKLPDLVLSGVNCGANISDDVTYSGTIAGAIEGTLLGIPSIALSQRVDYETSAPAKWQTAAALGPALMRRLLDAGWPGEVLLNVNFPDFEPAEVTGVKVTGQGRRDPHFSIEDRLDTHGRNYYWIGFNDSGARLEKGTDLWALHHGAISVTPLKLNLTDYETCLKLEQTLDS
jgi:5'-nucleotidase